MATFHEKQLFGDAKKGFNFDESVFDYYMEHGNSCTAKELAEFAGVSIGKVRKEINGNLYACSCTTKQVACIEKNYGTVHRHIQVNAYQPSRSQLRDKLLQSQDDCYLSRLGDRLRHS